MGSRSSCTRIIFCPQVATNIIYRVGSKDETSGRTGFAHLFEHLMFMGTQPRSDQGVRRMDGIRGGFQQRLDQL